MQRFIDCLPWPLLLKASWQAAVLIVLVLAVQYALGRRLHPRWRAGLWLLVVLRLALPWTMPSAVSLFNIVNFPRTSEAVADFRAKPPPPPALQPTVSAPVEMPAQPAAAAAPSAAPVFSLGLAWLPLAWAAGAFAMALCLAMTHCRLARRVAPCRPLMDDGALNLLEDCKERMGVRVPVALVETAAVEGPCLFGFVRPRLLLPPGFTRGFSLDELRFVFLHELAHLKRRDIPLGWLAAWLQILHWFNPLVWLAFSRMRLDRELACDALALSCAGAGEKESYGLTIVKLLEGFGQSGWAPGVAGILENKRHIKERITMIAKFHKTNRGLAAAIFLVAGLAVVTLTDAQNQTRPPANIGEPDASKGVWVVRFEPVGDFAPRTPGEFLHRANQSGAYSGRDGEIGYFRTKKQDDKLIGSFLAYDGEQLKAALAKAPGLKVTSVEKLTREQLAEYEKSPQESLSNESSESGATETGEKWEQQQLKMAQDGNKWAAYRLWDSYDRGNNGVNPDPAKADKWLRDFVQNVWVVRFEPINGFTPASPREFLARVNHYAHSSSGRTDLGTGSFFRTTKQGDILVGSFLCSHPDQLKAGLAKAPGLKVTSAEQITPEQFIKYEQSKQESL